jgi:O-succinylbenzoate synthase
LNVLVLKPVRIGSMARIELIERLATEHAVDVVYTSMLESSVGIACTIGFMSAAHNWELAHGLDTARWLNTDTLVEPLISRAGRLRQIDVTALPRMIREPYRSVLGIR